MNLIFDFDGTICDSFDRRFKIITKYFPELDSATLNKKYVRIHGIEKLIKIHKLTPLKVARIVAVDKREMKNFVPKLKAFPKFKEVVKILSNNHTLGILTTNSTNNVNQFLRKNKMDRFFTFVHSEESLYGKARKLKKLVSKYNLRSVDTLYIGDETRDVEAAKKTGIKSAAVTWGVESKTLLQKSEPDMIIEKVEDLIKIGGKLHT